MSYPLCRPSSGSHLSTFRPIKVIQHCLGRHLSVVTNPFGVDTNVSWLALWKSCFIRAVILFLVSYRVLYYGLYIFLIRAKLTRSTFISIWRRLPYIFSCKTGERKLSSTWQMLVNENAMVINWTGDICGLCMCSTYFAGIQFDFKCVNGCPGAINPQ